MWDHQRKSELSQYPELRRNRHVRQIIVHPYRPGEHVKVSEIGGAQAALPDPDGALAAKDIRPVPAESMCENTTTGLAPSLVAEANPESMLTMTRNH